MAAVRCTIFSADPVEIVGKYGPLNRTAVLAASFRAPFDPARVDRFREPLKPRPAARAGTRELRPSAGGDATTTPLTGKRSLVAVRSSLSARSIASSSPRPTTPAPSTRRLPLKRAAASAPARPPTAGVAPTGGGSVRPADSSEDEASGRVRRARTSASRALSPGCCAQPHAVAARSAPPPSVATAATTPRWRPASAADSLAASAAALEESALLDALPFRASIASTARSAPGSPLEAGGGRSPPASDDASLSGWATDSQQPRFAEVPAPQPRWSELEPSELWRARADGLLAPQAARTDGGEDVANAADAPRGRGALAPAPRVSTAWASPHAARGASMGGDGADAPPRRRLRAQSAARVAAASSSRRRPPRASKQPRSTSLAAARPRSSSAPPASRLAAPRVSALPLPIALAPARPNGSNARARAKQPPPRGERGDAVDPARAGLTLSRAAAMTGASSTSTPRSVRSSTPASTRIGSGGGAARTSAAHVTSPRALAARSGERPPPAAATPAQARTPPPRWSSGSDDRRWRPPPPPTARPLPERGVGADPRDDSHRAAELLKSRRLSAEQRAEAIAFMRAKQRERLEADASSRAAAAAIKDARAGALSRLASFYAQPASSGGALAVDARRRSARSSVASSIGLTAEVALPAARACDLDALAASASSGSASPEGARRGRQLLDIELAALEPEVGKHELVYEAERRALEQIRIAGAHVPELLAGGASDAPPRRAEEPLSGSVARSTADLREQAIVVAQPRGWLLAETHVDASVPTASVVSAITAEILADCVAWTIASSRLEPLDGSTSSTRGEERVALSLSEPRAAVDSTRWAEASATTDGAGRSHASLHVSAAESQPPPLAAAAGFGRGDMDAPSAASHATLAPAAHAACASMRAPGMRTTAAAAASTVRSPDSPRAASSPSALSPMMAVWPAAHEHAACLEVRATTAGTRCPSGRPAASSASPRSPSSASSASGARPSQCAGALDVSPALQGQPRSVQIRATSPPGERSAQSPGSPVRSPSHFRGQHAIFSLGPYSAAGARERVAPASADEREERPNADALHFAAPYSSRRSGAQQPSAPVGADAPSLRVHAQVSGGTSDVALVDDERVKVTMLDELDDLFDIELATRGLRGDAPQNPLDAFGRRFGAGSHARSVLAAALCERSPSAVTPTRVPVVLRDLLHGSVRDDARHLAQAKANVSRLVEGKTRALDGTADVVADLAEAVELEREFADVGNDFGSILSELERAIVQDLIADTASALASACDD